MNDSKPPGEAAHLLDDLESIRALLGDEPPLLTDILDPDSIPLLSDVVHPAPQPAAPAADTPLAPPPATPAPSIQLSRLTPQLQTAAQLILQEVVDDFVPQIEAELKRRLETRLNQLLQPK